MIHSRILTRLLQKLSLIDIAYAHCDIPCGIYDPNDAIQAAQTCIRMTELILEKQNDDSLSGTNSISRYISVKEIHAKKAKEEILIIWTDYFKENHLEKYPDLHEKVWKACQLGSQVKQNIDMDKAEEFKASLEEIGKIFLETKK